MSKFLSLAIYTIQSLSCNLNHAISILPSQISNLNHAISIMHSQSCNHNYAISLSNLNYAISITQSQSCILNPAITIICNLIKQSQSGNLNQAISIRRYQSYNQSPKTSNSLTMFHCVPNSSSNIIFVFQLLIYAKYICIPIIIIFVSFIDSAPVKSFCLSNFLLKFEK